MLTFLQTFAHALRGHHLRIMLCTGPDGRGWSDICSCGTTWQHDVKKEKNP